MSRSDRVDRDGHAPAGVRPTALVGVDFEDWHALTAARFGGEVVGRSPALERQTRLLLDLLEALGATVTFFVLGVTGQHHPHLLAEIVARGHELASHGFDHRPLTAHTPTSLARDLARSRDLLLDLCGVAALGYRAPLFSLGARQRWALRVIRDAGFTYDSSLYDTPRTRGRLRPGEVAPHAHELGDGDRLWEVPPTVAAWGPLRVPVAGSTYWRVLPPGVVQALVRREGRRWGTTALYFHPYDFDSERLTVARPDGAPPRRRAASWWQECLHNVGPDRARVGLTRLAEGMVLRPYRDAVPAPAPPAG